MPWQPIGLILTAVIRVQHYEQLGELPHFNPDLDGETVPEAAGLFRSLVANADAVVISTPEYAHGLPGAFKNALDWLASDPAFVAERDSFYLATTGETGWPYIQHRGGPRGFLRVLNDHTLGFADFGGNRQLITVGNLATNNRVALFFMDYNRCERMKLLSHARVLDADEDSALAAQLAVPDYRARIERLFVIDVVAFDWNCPQHITPRIFAQPT